MKILITGAAGFIGYSFSEYLCKNFKNYKIIGIDNLNNYYSTKLKKQRLKSLKKYKNFKFIKLDISNFNKLNHLFKLYNFRYIYNFAAQAGVRYSFKNPSSYIQSNFNGYFNILDLSVRYKIKRLFYASSSSVYGEKKTYPTKETDKSKPINIYSLSKNFNESITAIYSKQYGINAIGLRFFSVYGEWGRPDMLIFKILYAIKSNSTLKLNNSGNHYRDFTYIQDVNKILIRLIKYKNKSKHEIFNICSGKTVNIKKLTNFIRKKHYFNYKNTSKHSADLIKTHGSNKRLLNVIGNLKFTDIYEVIFNILNWYKKNNIHKLT